MNEKMPAYLRLNRLRVLHRGQAVYDHSFHEGVNIIRGQNGSGKSTIADFIFFVLGGEFQDWKEVARQCDEVQAEAQTPRGKLTLKRRISSAQEPVQVYFGSMAEAEISATEGWEWFPLRRHGGRESFSQVMFRSMLVPEAPSQGTSNITMHQLLRLCYSDQRTPATHLFRFEQFDTHAIREAVGDLICGIGDYERYDIDLELREREKELAAVDARLSALQTALPTDQSLNTPTLINGAVERLRAETQTIRQEIADVDKAVEPGQVREYLGEREQALDELTKQRENLRELEATKETLEFELREIREFMGFLAEQIEKVGVAELASDAIGSIAFTHCPACGEALDPEPPASRCIVCKTELDEDREDARYNQIRLDLEIQTRESQQLNRDKQRLLRTTSETLVQQRRDHEKALSAFDLKYAGAKGPREAFLAARTSRLGHIEAEIDFLLRSLSIAHEISEATEEKAELTARIATLRAREDNLRAAVERRRPRVSSLISEFATSILHSDLPRQAEFMQADNVLLDFRRDTVEVDGRLNFAESSNVLLKNTAVLALLLAAGTDVEFHHPRFLLIDNVEDKGMEVERSHLFQQVIVERAAELDLPYQVIFTTSMMNPALEQEEYIVGPAYTSENRCLEI